MSHRIRLVALLLVGLLLAACADQVGPSGAVRAETHVPTTAPLPTADPCTVALTDLGAFTTRTADELAVLRGLAVAKRFDVASTLAATRRVSATFTTYAGLEGVLARCAVASGLASRVGEVQGTAEATLEKWRAASVADAKSQRGTAVSLVGLLPEVLAMSKAGASIAGELGVPAAVAEVVDGVEVPIGSLSPLPTPSPKATPTPDPALRTVALPKLSVKIAGATKIKYFSISGDSPMDLATSMEKSSRRYCDQDALACVEHGDDISWVTVTNPSSGSCRITSVRVSVKATVYMPRWTKPTRVPPALLAWWRTVNDHIAWHEGQHIKIAKTHAAKLRSDLAGEPCSRSQRVIDRWSKRERAAQAAFDSKDRAWGYPVYNGPGGFYGN